MEKYRNPRETEGESIFNILSYYSVLRRYTVSNYTILYLQTFHVHIRQTSTIPQVSTKLDTALTLNHGIQKGPIHWPMENQVMVWDSLTCELGLKRLIGSQLFLDKWQMR